MKTNLVMRDCLGLMMLLPGQGDFLTMSVVSDLRKKCGPGFDLEYEKQIDYKATPGGVVQWNTEKDTGREFEFSDTEVSVIRKTLKEADTNKTLRTEQLNIYRIFAIDNPEPPKEPPKTMPPLKSDD